MILVKAAALRKSYSSDAPVLRGVDLELSRGEIVALLGGNGSGKTTLMRILATVLTPDSGEAWVAGRSLVGEATEARRHLAWVPAIDGGFQPMLDGRRNLMFWAAYYDVAPEQAGRVIDSFAGLKSFGAALTTQFYRCSTGMRQALALCRALLQRPSVLLLDEPFRSLDPEARHEIQGLLRLAMAEGTVLFSTHQTEESDVFGTRKLRLANGVFI